MEAMVQDPRNVVPVRDPEDQRLLWINPRRMLSGLCHDRSVVPQDTVSYNPAGWFSALAHISTDERA